MNKIVKISFVCASLFAFVNAQAQVIESVSFTPAKAGNYQTIATKSVTSFAGNLNASEINGLGYKLNLNTNTHLPFAANTTLGAHRDVYMLTTPTLPSTSTVSLGENGKLYTTGDTTVTNSTVNLIYGGDTDFSNAGGLITKNGVLKFHEVQMANPYCDIQWIKLPATDVNHDYNGDPDHDNSFTPTFSDYWFAYCGTANTPEPSVSDWETSITSATILGTCSAGWDGAKQDPGDDPVSNSCGYNVDATKSSFFCSAQTLEICTPGSLSYGPGIISNESTLDKMCSRRDDKVTRTLAGYTKDENNMAKCNLNGVDGQGQERPLAVEVFNETIPSSELKVSPSHGTYQSQCDDSNFAQNYGQAMARIKRGWRKMYCGFWANTPDDATDQIKGMKHASCQGTPITTPYCEDLYGNGYELTGNDALTDKQICQGIKDKNPAGIDVNNFTCIKVGPDRNKYKAARAATCNKYRQVNYSRCNDNAVLNCNPRRCRKLPGFSTDSTHQIIDEPMHQSAEPGHTRVECNPASQIWDNYLRPMYPSDVTIYFEQPAASQILTCIWHN